MHTEESNILPQLAVPSLDFTKVETNILLLQTMCQAGEPHGENVFSHEILSDETFGTELIFQLGNALHRVRDNWSSYHTLAGFVHLAARLLSLTSSTKIQNECLNFLAEVRQIAFGWVGLIRVEEMREEPIGPQPASLLSYLYTQSSGASAISSAPSTPTSMAAERRHR